MLKKLEYTLQTTHKIYTIDKSFYQFYDVTLSLIAWNLLSNPCCTSVFDLKNTAIEANSFSSVVKTIGDDTKNIYSIINESINYWDNLLKTKQKCESSFLKWDNGITENLPIDSWYQILKLWEDFFNLYSFDNTDILYKLWEYIEKYYVANYKDENIHLAPKSLISNMIQYLDCEDENTFIYDPYARTGNLLAEAQRTLPGLKEINGIFPTQISWKLANIRLLFSGIISNIHLIISDNDINSNKMFNVIISNPPYGDIRDNIHISVKDKQLATIAMKSKRLEVIFLSHILDRLLAGGRAAILLPHIFLTGNSTVKDLMEYILQQNILDIVIELPSGLFEHTAIAPVLFCLNKKREKNKNIALINAVNEVSKIGRQLYLNEGTLSDWIQQVKNGNIQNGEKIIQITSNEVISEDFNFYKLLHRYEKENTAGRKPVTELLAESEELKKNLADVQQEITVLIENYNNNRI